MEYRLCVLSDIDADPQTGKEVPSADGADSTRALNYSLPILRLPIASSVDGHLRMIQDLAVEDSAVDLRDPLRVFQDNPFWRVEGPLRNVKDRCVVDIPEASALNGQIPAVFD